MQGAREKITIRVSEQGVRISTDKGECLDLTAVEALLVLDILKEEEGRLRSIADSKSPLPFRVSFSGK